MSRVIVIAVPDGYDCRGLHYAIHCDAFAAGHRVHQGADGTYWLRPTRRALQASERPAIPAPRPERVGRVSAWLQRLRGSGGAT